MGLAEKLFLKPEKMFGWIQGYRIDWNKRFDITPAYELRLNEAA